MRALPGRPPPRCTTSHPHRRPHPARAAAGGPPGPGEEEEEDATTTPAEAARAAAAAASPGGGGPRRKKQAESTDFIASALTRRFGIAGGLAWVAFLAFGSLGEQVKTRYEAAQAERGTAAVADAAPVDLGGGVVYQDTRVGGGEKPRPGLLAVVELAAWPAPPPPPPGAGAQAATPAAALAAAKAAGPPFVSTKASGKPLVLLVGGRPLTGGVCPGAEAALLGMRAGGVRLVAVPARAGFGDRGAVIRPTRHNASESVIPPGTDLVYSIELLRVSVPPS